MDDAGSGAVRQLRFVRPPGSTSILLIRHGESEPADANAPFPLVEGQGDPALSPVGVEQAERVCERLAPEGIAAIYVSNLRRTAQTAAPLAATSGLTPNVEPDLREVHLGDWEGGAFRFHVSSGHPIALEMAERERWDVIPGAEADTQFASRVRSAMVRLAEWHSDETVAVFTHGGVIASLLAQATASRPFAFSGADNASISHLVVSSQRWVLRSFNDCSHLNARFTQAATPLS